MKMKNIKKLIASATLSAALVFGAVSTASAYWYDDGDFTIGIMGETVEMAIEMGNIAYESPDTMYDIPVMRQDLFHIDDVATIFNGNSFSDLSLVAYMATTSPYTNKYRGYFAVQDGWTNGDTPDTIKTNHNAIDSFKAAANQAGILHNDDQGQGGYSMALVGDRSIKWGMSNGIYNGFLNETQPGHGQYGLDTDPGGLELLGSGGDYTMNIWMDGDDNGGMGAGWDEVWDYNPTKLNYNVHVGVDESGMVYAETVRTSAVPIPGAVWLLGSGILAIMGMKRKK